MVDNMGDLGYHCERNTQMLPFSLNKGLKMNINKKILSLPPYISTSWSNIKTLRMEGTILNVDLSNGETIRIPDLSPELIETVFNGHAIFADQHTDAMPVRATPPPQSLFGNEDMTFRFGFAGLDGMGTALQHNPSQMNGPDIPPEVLEKIAAIAKVIAPADPDALPKPEPHCNCMHCQISRAISKELSENPQPQTEPEIEEEICEEDLAFCQWEIKSTGDDLYAVTNRLDPQEKYSVYLGHPVGCTCGHENCEHIIAVLRN